MRGRQSWTLLLLACALTLVLAETVLFGLASGLLTSGYNSPRLDRWELWLAFLPGSLLLDLWLVVCLSALAVPLLRRISDSRLQVFVAVPICALGPPASFLTARYDLHARFGDLFSLTLARQFSMLGASETVGQIVSEAAWAPVAMGGGVAAAIGLWLLAGRWSRSERGWLPSLEAPPTTRGLLVGCLALTGTGAVLTALTASHDALSYGFDRKLSGRMLGTFLDQVLDLDRDGFGSLRHPVDPAPTDPVRFPYALDVPGNGIDENGIGGDHPYPLPTRLPAEAALPVEGGPRPHLLLVYLESFREDLLDRRVAGRPVTPFLDRLAKEGGASRHAYTHAPWTLQSRAQLFGGRLLNQAGQSTIIDDFQARGYRVAHFSGQDESYGDSVPILGADRADFFYDARDDLDRRTTRSTSSVSLQVSWKTLLERVDAFLDGYAGREPLFLYVNVVDTHFPYEHSEIDPILDVPMVGRSGIRADAAREVFESYANTAANVDRAVEQLTARFREAIGGEDHAILVTADHGQAFYEYGTLGHGQHVRVEETRVPFIVWGMGGDWPEPIALTDVRGLLRENLGRDRQEGEPPLPRFVPDPERRILQYAARLEEPRYIAHRGTEDAIQYDFARDRWERRAHDGARSGRPVEDSEKLRLVWSWEAAQWLTSPELLEAGADHAVAGPARPAPHLD